MSLYIPPDIDHAANLDGVYCGHGALATAAEIPLSETLNYLPAGWVNMPYMQGALVKLGILPRTIEGAPRMTDRPDGDRAVLLIQFMGKWMDEGVHPSARCRYRHWITLRQGLVFDINRPEWLPFAQWAADVLPLLLPARATGWETFRTLAWQA